MSLAPQMLEENEMDGYPKIREYEAQATARIAAHYSSILKEIGELPEREGLAKTPERVAKALQFLTHGYALDPAALLNSAKFRENYQQMVLVRDIEVYSLREHHIPTRSGRVRAACRSRSDSRRRSATASRIPSTPTASPS